MEASYNKLQEYFDEKLPTADKVAEALTLHSYEVENIEEVGGDYILYIDVLPNRASDSSDEYGIVRELSAILNIKLKRLGNPITKWSEIKINISVSEINKLLGSNISIKEIENIFNRLGFKFDLNGEWFVVNPPYERKDLELKADVIEEVGRIYGYKNIEAMLPEKPKKRRGLIKILLYN